MVNLTIKQFTSQRSIVYDVNIGVSCLLLPLFDIRENQRSMDQDKYLYPLYINISFIVESHTSDNLHLAALTGLLVLWDFFMSCFH